MTTAAFHQASFLGGAIGPLSQGRSDLPMYQQALNISLNGIIAEEGAWVRRSGFQWLAKTRNATYAKLLPLHSSATEMDFAMEFTDGYVRFFNGTSICFTAVQSVVTASSFAAGVLTLTVASGTGFATLDDIMLWAGPTHDPAKIQAFRGRVMRLTGVAGAVLTVADEAGVAFSGLSSTASDLVGTIVYQVAHLTTSWSGSDVLSALRAVHVPQVSTGAYTLVLSHTVVPTGIIVSSTMVVTKTAAINDPVTGFSDGPYLDPQGIIVDLPAETGTINAYSGSATFIPASTVFVAADVGRCIRFFQEPPAWAVGTTYAFRDVVTYNGEWWTSTGTGAYVANVGNIPGTPGTFSGVQVQVWAPAPDQGVWAWGVITAQAGTSATVALKTPLKSANGTTISIWRLGLYKENQYPTCGVFSDGRLWLGGAVPNRWDAGMAGENPLHFSPTAANGQVNDNHAITYYLNATDLSTIRWMATDQQGVLMGTPSGEWLVSPLTEGAMTPTNVQATRVSKHSCADMEPQRTDMALIFVQRYRRSVIELLPEGFTAGRFVGRSLNGFAKHYAETGIEEIAYQQETVPILWARMTDGTLAGCTYRRTSRFITETPAVEAWCQHIFSGTDVGVVGLCVLPSPQGLMDSMYAVTADVNSGEYAVQMHRPLFEEA